MGHSIIMCGIFALLNNVAHTFSPETVQDQFMKGQSRGPEFSQTVVENNIQLGFHRLAINGLNEISNQPFDIENIVLICNGEIYNYKNLYEMMNITPTTGSDCEVIVHLYLKYGIQQTLIMLDGVYAFVLYDRTSQQVYVARDPLGVRPLYFYEGLYKDANNYIFGFASELKCLEYFYNHSDHVSVMNQFTPGTYSMFTTVKGSFVLTKTNIPYYMPSFSNPSLNVDFKPIIRTALVDAVNKRCVTTERPIACLLSGGLDSSLIAALVNNYYRFTGKPNQLETYSIGLKGSEDLKYARLVADYLGTNHTEVVVTEEEMFESIPHVIRAIESYDTTSVRASIGNYLIGKYISEHSTAKVIFNGDGSDELFGGYLYMNKCPDDIEFDKETRRLLNDIHLFDVLRSDKCISSHGLEPRTPFLDKTFVNTVLMLSPSIRNHNNIAQTEKYILRQSFRDYDNICQHPILPREILWRKKEAFSDGVSSHGRSLYQILQEKIANKLSLEPMIETEKKYYSDLFESYYTKCKHVVPYFWMPKYTDAVDPSARTLDIYT